MLVCKHPKAWGNSPGWRIRRMCLRPAIVAVREPVRRWPPPAETRSVARPSNGWITARQPLGSVLRNSAGLPSGFTLSLWKQIAVRRFQTSFDRDPLEFAWHRPRFVETPTADEVTAHGGLSPVNGYTIESQSSLQPVQAGSWRRPGSTLLSRHIRPDLPPARS